MNIEITKLNHGSRAYYRADCTDLPGSPPVGHGITEAEAVAHLMYRVLFSRAGPFTKWTDHLEEKPLSINSVKWTWPKGIYD